MKYDKTKSLGQNAINGVDITEPEEYANRQGECPKCHSTRLDYGAIRHFDDASYFPYKCKDCGQEGEEWYNLQFIGHNIYTEDGDVIEL